MERIGIYGGTYNPPHIGHMRAAQYAMKALNLDRLLLIPASIAPHKELPEDSASPEQRLDMLKLSAAGIEGASVSDMELKREGKSYSVDTVLALREEYPDARLVLLMGTDMFLSFESWYRAKTIMENVTLAVFYRGEKKERSAVEEQKRKLEALGAEVKLVENPVTAISSTDLRRMLAFGCADPFLCSGVPEYIRRSGLYGTAKNYQNLPMEKLERVVISLLNPNRVAHVLGCRDTAVKLARHWGADETDAARAGILHDITKAIDGPLQLTLCAEYGILLSKFSQENPKTLHALTGSLVAERIFGENKAVVEAIRHHTTGKADMSLLEKIIYVADYMEPCRNFPGVEKLREAAYRDIDEAMLMGLDITMAHLANQGNEVAPASAEAIAFLKAQGVSYES